ncbi:hypothetical protein [Neorhizobium sp. NCHU2750]|uniref:hypothetical protein n=1 Tax=Neorhizobium sp. NCHU2750 TaxID=1825976 RepID=UPI000E747BBB|nr:hypothetical protein NCHU2750_28100 [Neorhizobium sp. NCHU2750]
MKLRPGRVAQSNRGPIRAVPPQKSTPMTFQAPAKGLYTTTALSDELPGAAAVLNNWLPTLTGARIRGGSKKKALIAGGADFVTAFTFKYGGAEKLFMATASAIFDMTSPAAPPVITAPVLSGMVSGDWSAFQHSNASGSYLIITNGANPRQVYNGTSWTTPAITFPAGDTTTTAQLSQGWLFKKREFFVKAGTMDAYYLPTEAISGAAKAFPLGSTFKNGGSLLMGFNWSIESGSGPNEFCVFVTTEGEVAIFQGSDPDTAGQFTLQGVYQIGKPLGKNAFIKVGGDVLVATVSGLIPMSQVLQRSAESLSTLSKSRPIEDDWTMAATAVSSGWALTYWPEQKLIFVSFPDNIVSPDTTFVMNAVTGAWGIIKNWKATCFGSIQGSLFFGSLNGLVWQGDITGTDDGKPFQAAYLSQFLTAGTFGQRKEATLGQMHVKAKEKPKLRLFARADGDDRIPNFSEVTESEEGASEWDVGLWDVAKWDASSSLFRFEYRQNVRAAGDTLALGCVVVSGGPFALKVMLDFGTMQVALGEQSA